MGAHGYAKRRDREDGGDKGPSPTNTIFFQ